MFVLILLDFLYDFCMFLVLGISFCNAVVQAKKITEFKKSNKKQTNKKQKKPNKNHHKVIHRIDEKMW
jgi:hypothetical protein